MGYFDEENKEKENGESASGMSTLAENALNEEEDKAEERARKKEEKARQKELRKIEKLEKKRKKREEKGLFTGDIDDSIEKKEHKISGEKEEKPAAENAEPAKTEAEPAEPVQTEAVVQAAAPEKDEAAQPEASGETPAESSETVKEAETVSTEEEEPEEGKAKKSRRKKKKDQKTKPEDVNIVKDLLSLIIYIGIVVVVCFLIVTFVGQRTTVNGDSMNPTLESGDSLWINKLAYRFGDPERYDIIVFPYEEDVHYIKRVIGLPGETVQITNTGDILINGKILEEPTKFARIINPGRASNPITLGPDEYFVLGDNRNNSKDSRYDSVGNIKKENMIGKAVFRLTPFKKFGSIY